MNRDEFIAACREGGARMEGALRALDRAWAARLIGTFPRKLRDSGVAEDLVQETLIKAWQNCAQYRGDSEVFAWLRRILRNLLIDHLRRQAPEESLEDDEGELTLAAQKGIAILSGELIPSPETELLRAELRECLRRQRRRFREAAPLHASVLEWIAEEGLSNEEVAELLQRTPGATREFISQARKKARRIYAECYELAFGEAAVRRQP
jgi:RNA polymerase sigma-70 factor (ECF subfamily)